MSQEIANTPRAERNLFCAVCDKKSYVFTLKEISLKKHIQGIGEITYPARRKGRAVEIQVCYECSDLLGNQVIKAVQEYHLEE